MTAPVSGTLDWEGPNGRQVIRVDVPGSSQVTETRTVDGTTYEQRSGLSFANPKSDSKGDLASGMRSFLDLVDSGL